jgi:hypothetical protein
VNEKEKKEKGRKGDVNYLGMYKILSARTNPTVTSKLLAGSRNGKTNNMNPNTSAT